MRKQDNKHRMIESSAWHRDRALFDFCDVLLARYFFFLAHFFCFLPSLLPSEALFLGKNGVITPSHHCSPPLSSCPPSVDWELSGGQGPALSAQHSIFLDIRTTKNMSGSWLLFLSYLNTNGDDRTTWKIMHINTRRMALSLSLICLISFFPSSPLNC